MLGAAMTIRDAYSPAQTRPRRLRFDRYVLDLDSGCFRLDGNEIALRPKTFAVLHYLIENSGRLVSKDDLFAAVWPNLAVTDDALVQSIGELRRALGDDGPRLIKTIPRRGYRFESDVSVDTAIDQSSVDATRFRRPPAMAASSPEPVTSSSPTLFTTPPAGWRMGLVASLALVVLLAAGVLWTGLGSEWKFLSVLGSGDQFTTRARNRHETRDRHSPVPEPERRFGS